MKGAIIFKVKGRNALRQQRIKLDNRTVLFSEGPEWRISVASNRIRRLKGSTFGRFGPPGFIPLKNKGNWPAILEAGDHANVVLAVFVASLPLEASKTELAVNTVGGIEVNLNRSGENYVQRDQGFIEWVMLSEKERTDLELAVPKIPDRIERLFPFSVEKMRGEPLPAVYYFSKALEATDEALRFLFAMISLESMVSDGQEIADKLARRVAVLIEASRRHIQLTEQEVYDRLKGYYAIRSRILHGNRLPSVNTMQSWEILGIAQVALHNYLILLSGYKSEGRSNAKSRLIERLDRIFDSQELNTIRDEIALFDAL